ncbi:glyoxylate reductase [Alteribacillus persepolensis]|uniref:Glyoxylate/hydroxypyruvate reductase B n=1 Tax=Alteribacillus persepolensis TaxID=568899 RepID=A0A1G8ERU7_9BACI|nr:D-glycerate dehydrogenase [Alteribacillus persepolensis]SDH72603.1 glyoxylate reductase [Alteribacillus persepolensis]
MSKPYVYLTRKMPQNITDQLAAACDVGMWEKAEEPVPQHILKEEMKTADAVFCNVSDVIDKDMIDAAEQLKVIATMAVGYNNIDVKAAQEKNIYVAHTPGVLTETTADLTFALLMASARRIPEGIDVIKNNEWGAWAPFFLTGQDIYQARLGIIGMGRIGEAVAKRGTGFDMDIVYHNRTPKKEAEQRLGARLVDMDELLQTSDFVCVMTPYTKETHHLIDKQAFDKMKSSAIFINTSRGGTVDEEALYNALKNGDIRGAGLDVFENEPISADHPLLSLPNVTALPHIGSASETTRKKMAEMTANHILQALRGETPDYIVKE